MQPTNVQIAQDVDRSTAPAPKTDEKDFSEIVMAEYSSVQEPTRLDECDDQLANAVEQTEDASEKVDLYLEGEEILPTEGNKKLIQKDIDDARKLLLEVKGDCSDILPEASLLKITQSEQTADEAEARLNGPEAALESVKSEPNLAERADQAWENLEDTRAYQLFAPWVQGFTNGVARKLASQG